MVNSDAAKIADRSLMEMEPTPNSAGNSSPRQAQVYRQYLDLQSLADRHFAGSLAGRLIVSIGFGLQGAELALASAIAGAAFLAIEPDPRSLKAAVRNGSSNFMVNTLDEALRVLKNELRKRQPVSVGLLGSASDLLPAMIERGVQPDLLRDTTSLPNQEDYKLPQPAASAKQNVALEIERVAHRQALLQFAERGALAIEGASTHPSAETLQVTWTATTPQDMQRMDRLALEIFPADDTLHRRWLLGSAASFHRQRPLERVVELAQPQLQLMRDALARSSEMVPFATPAFIRWQNRDGSTEEVAW